MARLFRVSIPVGSLGLLVSETILIAAAFVGTTYLQMTYDWSVFLFDDGGIYLVLLVTAAIVIGLYFQDLYTSIHVRSRLLLLQQLSLVMGMAFLGMGLLSYVNQSLSIPLRVMLLGSAATMAALFLWRLIYAKYLLPAGAQRLLFVGSSPVMETIAQYIQQHPEAGMAAIGYIDDGFPPGTSKPGGNVLGHLADLREVAGRASPNRIVVGLSEGWRSMPLAELLDLRFTGTAIEEASTTYESVCMRISTLDPRLPRLISSGELGPRRDILRLQTIYSLVFALLGGILSLPALVLVAAGLKLTSRGPIICRQERVGLGGEIFTRYKFRSMDHNAETATGAACESKYDPRITPFGRFLRKSRLDGLPQLFNLLRGDMALVGPRPERPEFVQTLAEKIPYYRQRHSAKPGLTGWAQINHNHGDTLHDTLTYLEYDLYYIKNVSLSLDAYIILHTLKNLLLSRGAPEAS
jgi:exopolysaccharide biosynthesis polyprenyl glycosylphosphotransferase